MADLVTSAEAIAHIRIDNTADDAWLAIMIPAVSDAVLSWLKDEWRAYILATDGDGNVLTDSAEVPIIALDSNGEATVKPRVKAAVLVELAQQYRFRDGSGASMVPAHWGHGYVLGSGSTSLLAALRKTTVV
jgi:hypothetical protein